MKRRSNTSCCSNKCKNLKFTRQKRKKKTVTIGDVPSPSDTIVSLEECAEKEDCRHCPHYGRCPREIESYY